MSVTFLCSSKVCSFRSKSPSWLLLVNLDDFTQKVEWIKGLPPSLQAHFVDKELGADSLADMILKATTLSNQYESLMGFKVHEHHKAPLDLPTHDVKKPGGFPKPHQQPFRRFDADQGHVHPGFGKSPMLRGSVTKPGQSGGRAPVKPSFSNGQASPELRQLRQDKNLCFKCGRGGHSKLDCPNQVSVEGWHQLNGLLSTLTLWIGDCWTNWSRLYRLGKQLG